MEPLLRENAIMLSENSTSETSTTRRTPSRSVR